MHLIPARTGLLKEGDDLAERIAASIELQQSDIVVVSAKVVATVEGAAIDLATLEISDEAKEWAEKLKSGGKSAPFRQAVLNETKHMNGSIVSSCPKAMLCELKPQGLEQGTIMAINAGLDTSNAPAGYAIGWPRDPVASVRALRKKLEAHISTSSTPSINASRPQLAVILSDSCCRPRRIGVIAIALTVSGIDPLRDEVGRKDLFGHALRMTQEAVADQLATAANALMGNAAQGVPAVVIRNHGLELSDFEGWVPGIDIEEDLFRGLL